MIMTVEEAIRQLRQDPAAASLIHDSYLDEDLHECGERFLHSDEFAEVCTLLASHLPGARILDLGAGAGFSSYAFARSGASVVHALEPDESAIVGRGAIRRLNDGLPVEVMAGIGEDIPLEAGTVDIVYTRQVLHHCRALDRVLSECHRVLRPDGVFLACREHIVDDDRQLAAFLESHPLHCLTGGEHAYPLDAYVCAIRSAGFRLQRVIQPWDSIINAFPTVRTSAELEQYPGLVLQRRLGRPGALLSRVPGVSPLIWWRVRRRVPGRLYSFLAFKSDTEE
jgi:SAM-dependent methyltransferase